MFSFLECLFVFLASAVGVACDEDFTPVDASLGRISMPHAFLVYVNPSSVGFERKSSAQSGELQRNGGRHCILASIRV